MNKHIVSPEDAPKMLEWLRTRGGLAIWRSVDLSDPGKSWTTPVNKADGTPMEKQHWKMESQPSRVITDPAEVVVAFDEEIKRFRVAIRRGAQGLCFKLTDASSRRVRAAVDKAGENAGYRFDYDTQEAIIFRPSRLVPLLEWEKE